MRAPFTNLVGGAFCCLYLHCRTTERSENMTNAASEALRKIRALQKYPCPQTPHAIQKILKQLHVADYMAVVEALEALETQGSVARG